MATKKECDRCKKQWAPESESIYQLCTVTFCIEKWPGKYYSDNTKEIHETMELCQQCARAVYYLAVNNPNGDGPE